MTHSDKETIDSHTGNDTGHESVINMNMSSIMTLGGAIINLTWSHYRFKPATAVLTCAAVLQCAAQQSGQNWMLIRSKDSLLVTTRHAQASFLSKCWATEGRWSMQSIDYCQLVAHTGKQLCYPFICAELFC